MNKADLAEKIKRRLGYPMIKVELDNSQIYDEIDYARSKWMKWAVGNATQETFFTLMLSGGQSTYDMPVGVKDVVSYDDHGSESGINTLFTMENFFYNQGILDPLFRTDGYAYTLISYHIARDFLDVVKKYSPTKYSYKYHRYTNQLEVDPTPSTGNSLTVNGVVYDSPGYVLIRSFMAEGSTLDGWTDGDTDTYFYTGDWILDYATARCKVTLGMIRRKFANFAGMGNTGISLDGDTLVSEGKEEIERLEETLRLEESYEGYGIEIGY